MLIKIINGNYGYNNGEFVRAKTPADPPFDVDKSEAERLARLGIAEILETVPAIGAGAKVPAEDAADDADIGEAETAASADDFEDEADDSVEDDISDDIPKYGEESTNADLQAIAKEYGLEFPHKATKAQMIKILDNFFADDAPEVSVKEPE